MDDVVGSSSDPKPKPKQPRKRGWWDMTRTSSEAAFAMNGNKRRKTNDGDMVRVVVEIVFAG